jgi:hypothetical protein
MTVLVRSLLGLGLHLRLTNTELGFKTLHAQHR